VAEKQKTSGQTGGEVTFFPPYQLPLACSCPFQAKKLARNFVLTGNSVTFAQQTKNN
jgi:hypothetical protein